MASIENEFSFENEEHGCSKVVCSQCGPVCSVLCRGRELVIIFLPDTGFLVFLTVEDWAPPS